MHLGLLCYNGQEEATLSEILTHLEKVYCGQLSAEIHHIEVRHQGPVVRRPISANPGLDFNLGFFIPLL